MTRIDTIANPWIKALGIYEPGKPIEEAARELGFEDAGAIDKMASNENALGPSPAAIRAIREAAEGVHRYPDGGAYRLRRALSIRLGIDADRLLIGNGSNELLDLIGRVFLAPGRSMVMADRSFLVYRLVAAACRAEVIDVPMKDYAVDLDAMLKAIRPDTGVVFVSNPNNPTGTTAAESEIRRFIDRAPGHVLICMDEAYIDLMPCKDQPDTLSYVRDNAGRNVILLRTFSKAYGLAGLRVGYGIADPECIGLLNRVRQPFNVNSVAMAAALAALDDDAHVERTRAMVSEGLSFLRESFGKMNLEYVPSTVNFMLVKVGNGRRVFEALMRLGIIVRPMDAYRLPEHVRVTIGTRAENERFVLALGKVLRR